MEIEKKTKGGARLGAGRKRKGEELRVTLSCRISPSASELIKKRSSEAGMSVGEFLESLVK